MKIKVGDIWISRSGDFYKIIEINLEFDGFNNVFPVLGETRKRKISFTLEGTYYADKRKSSFDLIKKVNIDDYPEYFIWLKKKKYSTKNFSQKRVIIVLIIQDFRLLLDTVKQKWKWHRLPLLVVE